ncbi:MAG: hypothetical protein ACJAS1_007388 [Oleiphilaceae bacterium]|jgi:hypothetical protein
MAEQQMCIVNVKFKATIFLPRDYIEEDTLTIENVDMPVDLPSSLTGLTLLYGNKGIGDGFTKAFGRASKAGEVLHIVDLLIPFDMTAQDYKSVECLSQCHMLNLKKIDRSLTSLIIKHYIDYASVNGIEHDKILSNRQLIVEVSKHPLFSDYLVKQEGFTHLHAVAVPVSEEGGGLAMRANLYRNDRVQRRSIKSNTLMDTPLVLPDRVLTKITK